MNQDPESSWLADSQHQFWKWTRKVSNTKLQLPTRFFWILKVLLLALVLTLAHVSKSLPALCLPGLQPRTHQTCLATAQLPPRQASHLQAKPQKLEDKPHQLAPASAPSQFFANCKLQKTDCFPLLYAEKNRSIQRLNHDSSTYWINNLGNWAAAHCLHNIFELSDALVTISADGSQRLPLFLLNPEYENFAQETEGMLSVLLIVASTTFGMYHKVMEEQVLHMDERTTRAMFADLMQVASTLHFRLSHAAKSTKVP